MGSSPAVLIARTPAGETKHLISARAGDLRLSAGDHRADSLMFDSVALRLELVGDSKPREQLR
jgi:hypothetical protein